jgi:MFS family permease
MSSRYRWYVVGVFFAFMLLHQADKLLIGPLNTRIQTEFAITDAQMGAVSTGALIVAAVLYPVWGYLYDRFARARLVSLAALIWGSTTWLGAIAPTYGTFLAARSSTGVDDSSYPGIYSLLSDYFGPTLRGKVFGLLQLTAPIGFMIGLVMAQALGAVIGWRSVFMITGGLGIVMALIIFFTVREMKRGQAEPELEDLETIAVHRFDWAIARALLRKRTILPLFLQGFFGVFPLNVLSFWFFAYLERERGYDTGTVTAIMAGAVLVMATGAFLGGFLGDRLFLRTPRGRLIVSTVGVFMGALLFLITINVPHAQVGLFALLLAATALFTLFSGPNVAATMHDITVPEGRSTALAIQYFIESFGAAFAPLLVGWLSDQPSFTLESAILVVCVTTLLVCGVFLLFAVRSVPEDIQTLREDMQRRAVESRALASAAGD